MNTFAIRTEDLSRDFGRTHALQGLTIWNVDTSTGQENPIETGNVVQEGDIKTLMSDDSVRRAFLG